MTKALLSVTDEKSFYLRRIRRFSNVSETVSRKLSTTIGWPRPVSVQEVVAEAKSLCGQYIRQVGTATLNHWLVAHD